MKKVLLPIDGSVRSLRSLKMAKQFYAPGEAVFTILTVLPGDVSLDPAQKQKTQAVNAHPDCETEDRTLFHAIPLCSAAIFCRQDILIRFAFLLAIISYFRMKRNRPCTAFPSYANKHKKLPHMAAVFRILIGKG